MGKVLVTETYLADIADAIREKNGSEDSYLPSEMAEAISAIETETVIEDPTINGHKLASGSFKGDDSGEVMIEHNLGYKPTKILVFINTFGTTFESANLILVTVFNRSITEGVDYTVNKQYMNSTGSEISTGLITDYSITENIFSFTESTVMPGGEYYWIAY